MHEMNGTDTKGSVRGYEEKVEKLEGIVRKLESGGTNLEESLQLFEEGSQLLAECKKMLTSAQRRMEVLLPEDGEIVSFAESGLYDTKALEDDGGFEE